MKRNTSINAKRHVSDLVTTVMLTAVLLTALVGCTSAAVHSTDASTSESAWVSAEVEGASASPADSAAGSSASSPGAAADTTAGAASSTSSFDAAAGSAVQVADGSAQSQSQDAADAQAASTKAASTQAASAQSQSQPQTAAAVLTRNDITVTETLSSSADGEHVVIADGQDAQYRNIGIAKTGSSSGDEADFYGENAAVFATAGATLDLDSIIVDTDGTHANGVFSYGTGTTVNISNSVIETAGNCSGGLMTTGDGTMNATNLTIHTNGNSSAAIRSDRGGGTVTVTGGSYTTEGTGSPAIYSTADITVADAALESTQSQGVVVEGKNSVTLENADLTANNVNKNSKKSSWYQAVMLYQSMSGDAKAGQASFTMDGGTLTNNNGDVFFISNTSAAINLTGVLITNNDDMGLFLRAAAAGWGKEGSNGGHVTLNASNQVINGDMVVDDISSLELNLADASLFTGAINGDGAAGEVSVYLSEDSVWVLTADSYITGLGGATDKINLNGYTLYVNGEAFSA